MPGALTIVPSILNLKSPTGVFTGVTGVINAVFKLPDGYTLDTGYGAKVTMKTPLSTELFEAVVGLGVIRRQDADRQLRQGRARQQHTRRHGGSADGLRLVPEWRSAEAADVNGQRTRDEVSESAVVQKERVSERKLLQGDRPQPPLRPFFLSRLAMYDVVRAAADWRIIARRFVVDIMSE